MPDLSPAQYFTVYNMLSFTIASMIGAFAFFVLSKNLVAPKYQLAVIVSSIVVFIAGYHYFRIFGSWADAYSLNAATGAYEPTGKPFNDAYRYVDWLLTVPLLLVELIAVLALPRAQSRSLLTRLVIAAVLMIALGYPGEVATETGPRIVWFVLSCIPFVYILYVLWFELSKSLDSQPREVVGLISVLRYIILVTWLFYPIAYLLQGGGAATPGGEVGMQVGYSIADVLAKAGYGIFIFLLALRKTQLDSGKTS